MCWRPGEEERCRRRSRSPAVILWSLSRPICLFSRWGTLRQHHTGGVSWSGVKRRVTSRTPAAPGPPLANKLSDIFVVIYVFREYGGTVPPHIGGGTREISMMRIPRRNSTISFRHFIAQRLNTFCYIAPWTRCTVATARKYLPSVYYLTFCKKKIHITYAMLLKPQSTSSGIF